MNHIIDSIIAFGFQHSKTALLNYYNDITNNVISNDYLQYVTINPHHYHRSKVFENDFFEIYIITWNTYQRSQFHDHSENGCYAIVLQGELTEEITDNDNSVTTITTQKEGDVTFIANDIGLHRISNPSSTNIAISLHVYSPPNHKTKTVVFPTTP
jgi:cysteine dioxygenase